MSTFKFILASSRNHAKVARKTLLFRLNAHGFVLRRILTATCSCWAKKLFTLGLEFYDIPVPIKPAVLFAAECKSRPLSCRWNLEQKNSICSSVHKNVCVSHHQMKLILKVCIYDAVNK